MQRLTLDGSERTNKMTDIKELFENFKLVIQGNDEQGIELPAALKIFVLSGLCISCNNPDTLRRRKMLNEMVMVESYHCPNCKENWTYEVNVVTDTIFYHKTETNWVDLWKQKDND